MINSNIIFPNPIATPNALVALKTTLLILGYDNNKIENIRGVRKQNDKPVLLENKYFGLKSGNKVFGFTGPQNTINAIIKIRYGIPKGFINPSLFFGKRL